MAGMNVWKSFANLKDTIGQVATDILDTTEEGEGIDSPSPLTYRDHVSTSGSDADRSMELQWYKNEVVRLQAAESEIQSLSVNYGDLLKQREVEVEELRKQNAELKLRLCDSDTKESDGNASGGFGNEEIPRLREAIKGLQAELQRAQDLNEAQAASLQENHRKRTDALIARHRREVAALQAKLAGGGNHVRGGAGSGGETNGEAAADASKSKILELEQKLKKLQEREKDLARQVVDKDQSYGRLKEAYELAASEAKALKAAVEQERASSTKARAQLAGLQGASQKAVEDARALTEERQQMAAELEELRGRLLATVSSDGGELAGIVTSQGEEIRRLKEENESLRSARHSLGVQNGEAVDVAKDLTAADGMEAAGAQSAPGASLSAAERELLDARIAAISLERDKAKKDLARLKQHLLDKETQESEKLEMDSARLWELEERAKQAEEQARSLEGALTAARAEAEGARDLAKSSTQSSQGELARLRGELAGAVAALEAKDAELANLQTALGQYYAESEAQERLYGELSMSKEEVKSLTTEVEGLRGQLATRMVEVDRASSRLVQVEAKLAESQGSLVRLQDEVTRLRRALEHSMTRMNRMSADSDFMLDRRIVVKLMVTFFERHHSKEVLDLMAKMLCFSDEDKKRVGLAQQGSRGGGVVRGVLNLPGRLVGGLIGAAAGPESPTVTVDENQTFADLWIDFLVRESEERERRDQERRDREKAEADILTEPRMMSPLSPVSRQRAIAESGTPAYPPRPSTPGHGGRSHSLDVSPSASKRDGANNPLSPAGTPGRGSTHGGDLDGSRHAETPRASASSPGMGAKDVDQGYASGGEFSPIPLHGVTPKATSMGGVFVPRRAPRP